MSLTALLASASRLGHTASPAWGLGAALLDALTVALLVRAIRRVGAWSGAGEGPRLVDGVRFARVRGVGGAVRIELGTPRMPERRRVVAATAIGGACVLLALGAPTGRPDHSVFGLALLGTAAALSTLSALPVVALVVDVASRRVASQGSVFTIARGASLCVIDGSDGARAPRLVIAGLAAPPLVSESHAGREQLTNVARALAALLGDVEVGP